MDRKRKKQCWVKNIESIFTKEKLDELVKEGYLERVKRKNIVHYIKHGSKKWVNPDDFKE